LINLIPLKKSNPSCTLTNLSLINQINLEVKLEPNRFTTILKIFKTGDLNLGGYSFHQSCHR